jgi:uncharacterized protein (TIGR03067 family)
MRRHALVSVFALALVASFARADDKSSPKEIVGTWTPVTAELGGQKYPQNILDMTKLVIGEGTYLVTIGEQRDEGTLVYDNNQTPKAMDVKGGKGGNEGKTYPCIYELKGDTLRICYNLGGKTRPTEFKTEKGTKLYLVTYKRDKK